MVNSKIPKTLPGCELLHVLAEKAEQRRDVDFNFLGRLDEFRQRVSGEVRQINELFPEYTPHDEQYHLKQLFHVADTVLGRDRLEEMNSAELFVLAISLYGHDWGMAVSEAEKQYIVTGKPPEGMGAEDLWILPDERIRFVRFARKQRLTLDTGGCLEEMPIEMWREYVRQTHSFRSGERVRRFFESIDGGVAEAASRVCVGHRLDFEDLQDYRAYPPDFAVLRETVNLRALAVYLLLIDQLDLAEDRTPYVIWKFVAPRDPRSKMEWAKHRALRPVTCVPYFEGRIIRVDGSTDDHEVYAALEDLRIRCEEQLRGCNDVLARMNDPRHKLDLYHIEWRVAARGFKPVSIHFEFDRERMFEILGDDIYQGDPYVFLRELLQNSIDAIRMRREVLRRKGIAPGNLGEIHVTVKHDEGGDAVVTWRDDGIGMDEYTIRNYLAVAGKSYYRSPDFEREGLKMDPISRFGIGILSCFMVADRVEMETFKDPYLFPPGEPLRIIVPAVRRQFRIETCSQEGAQVGTTIRVFVDGKKIPTDDEDEPVKPLDVTAYLSIVAGFVEFPIIITEGDRRTIVLHPKQAAEAARQRFGEEFEVHQIDLGYPWSEVVLPQDLLTAREVLREEHYDLSTDLKLEGYDGTLTYFVPIGNEIDFSAFRSGERVEIKVIMRGQAEHLTKRVRWSNSWDSYEREAVSLSRSSSHSPTCAVYRDGILLPTASPPRSPSEWRTYSRALPVPRLVVNLSKLRTPRVDLARTQLLEQPEHWASPIFHAHLRHLSEASLKDLLALDPAERLYQLGRLISFHQIDPESLWKAFPQEHWPLPFLEAGGQLDVLEWQDVAASAIYLSPVALSLEIENMVRCRWLAQEKYEGPLIQWGGERCVVSNIAYHTRMSAAIEQFGYMWILPLAKAHRFAAIRFLRPPWEGDPPLLQRVWLPMEIPEELPIETILEKATEDPTLLNPVERALFYVAFRNLAPAAEAIEFPQPFEQSFAYGSELLNLKHPVTQALLRFKAALELSRRRRTLPEDRLGHLDDALASATRELSKSYDEYTSGALLRERWSNALSRMLSLAREVQLLDVGETEGLVLGPEEFVPGTTSRAASRLRERLARLESIRPFGQPLT
jgi:hypothetical protein